MTFPDLVARFVRPLNQLDLAYMVMGGVASIVYSEPRYTQDLDLLLALEPSGAGALAEEEARRPAFGHFNLAHHETGLRADLYLAGADPLHRWGLTRRRRIMLGEEPVWLAPIEYVILGKLKFYREGGSARHLEDVAAMLRISGDRVDFPELEAKIRELDLAAEWKLAQA